MSATSLNNTTSSQSKMKKGPYTLGIDLSTRSFENLPNVDSIYQNKNQNLSTSQLSNLSGDELNPLQRRSTRSRPRSVNELRNSLLFFDSEGNADRRLSVIFADPKDFSTPSDNSRRYHTLPKNLNRLSVSLTSSDNVMEAYRQNARKTNDPKIQLEFGKFLLESASNIRNKENFTYDPVSAEKLEKEGIFWIRKLQKTNNREALYIIGTWHEKGIYGATASESRANALYMTSAKLGFGPAMDKVAYYYERKKDYTRAIAYYKKAAALADPSANYRLGIAYIYGGLKLGINNSTAQFYLRRSSVEANINCPQGAYIWALILLGLYEKDLGIRDEAEGQECLIKAANLNYNPAQFKVGYCYEFGEYNFPVDPSQSIEYYKQAAQGGHADAQVSLSGWYLTGAPGILDQSDELAFQWCTKAAIQCLPKAEYALGQYYELGVGADPNMDLALACYKKAAAHGFEKAKERLSQNDLAPALTRSDYGSMRQQSRTKKKHDCVIS